MGLIHTHIPCLIWHVDRAVAPQLLNSRPRCEFSLNILHDTGSPVSLVLTIVSQLVVCVAQVLQLKRRVLLTVPGIWMVAAPSLAESVGQHGRAKEVDNATSPFVQGAPWAGGSYLRMTAIMAKAALLHAFHINALLPMTAPRAELLRKTEQMKEVRKKERLDDYYKRNFVSGGSAMPHSGLMHAGRAVGFTNVLDPCRRTTSHFSLA